MQRTAERKFKLFPALFAYLSDLICDNFSNYVRNFSNYVRNILKNPINYGIINMYKENCLKILTT